MQAYNQGRHRTCLQVCPMFWVADEAIDVAKIEQMYFCHRFYDENECIIRNEFMLSARRRRRGPNRFIADPKVSAFLAAIARFDYIITLAAVEHALSGLVIKETFPYKIDP